MHHTMHTDPHCHSCWSMPWLGYTHTKYIWYDLHIWIHVYSGVSIWLVRYARIPVLPKCYVDRPDRLKVLFDLYEISVGWQSILVKPLTKNSNKQKILTEYLYWVDPGFTVHARMIDYASKLYTILKSFHSATKGNFFLTPCPHSSSQPWSQHQSKRRM